MNKIFNKALHHKLIRQLRKYKLLLFFLLYSFTGMGLNSYSQTSMALNLKQASLKEVFQAIESQSEYIFLYQEQQLDPNRVVSLDAQDESLEEILEQVFEGSENNYRIEGRQVIVGQKTPERKPLGKPNAEQEKKSITGTVSDENGEPLPGVTVIVKGTTTGVITNIDGAYELQVPASAKSLLFSFVGMKSQEIEIAGRSAIDVVLTQEAVGLDELIVVGYGTQKKENLTGAVDQVSAESLKNTPVGSIGEVLQGQMANVNIGIADGKPGRNASFNIRGLTSINEGGPLILIDGVPGGDINTFQNRSAPDGASLYCPLVRVCSQIAIGIGLCVAGNNKLKFNPFTLKCKWVFNVYKAVQTCSNIICCYVYGRSVLAGL